MKNVVGNIEPKIWALQILVGFTLHYIIGGGLFGTIGTILGLVGLGNCAYFVFNKVKGSKTLKTISAIVTFVATFIIYGSLGVFFSGPTL